MRRIHQFVKGDFTFDWLAIPDGTRAKTVGLQHGAGNVVVVLLFIVSWFLRLRSPDHRNNAAFVLGFIAIGLGLVTSWLGGELVDRLGVGVDRGAHLNAPSSLSGQPAAGGRATATWRVT